MQNTIPRRRALAVALAIAVLTSLPATAQQVVADGDEQFPPAGDYRTTLPVVPGDPSGHAFYAINGGRIAPAGQVNLSTEGRGAHAAHAEGAGSTITLQGGSVLVTGESAAGLSAAAGATVHAVGTQIDATGRGARGILLNDASAVLDRVGIRSSGDGIHMNGGELQMRGSHVQLSGQGQHGVYVNGGIARIQGSQIELDGAAHRGALATGGAQLDVVSSRISGTGYSLTGATAHIGASLQLNDVDIELEGDAGTGVSLGGRVDISNSRITVIGDHGRAVDASRGELNIDNSRLAATQGIRMMNGGVVNLRDSEVHAEYHALDLNGTGNQGVVANSSLSTRNGTAIWIPGSSTLHLSNSHVEASGDRGLAVDVRGGEVQIQHSTLRTHGQSAHGIYADGNNRSRPKLQVEASEISTVGNGSSGVIARLGGSAHLVDSTVSTTGVNAYGVLAGGTGEVTLINTHVRTEGKGAWAAVINDNGRMTIDGGSLVSAQHGGVWLRSSRDPGLTLRNGAVVSGGNGIGLALDAAVAGRFDVALEGRSQLFGDIVITPEDEDAGLVPQSDVHVRLADSALWAGTSTLVQTLALEGGSQWTLTGDATVGELQARDSVVTLSDGSGRFNTLTVDGDLHSEGAAFVFQGALAGDDSAIDHLHVRGDTSGYALIAVNNIGGVGAPTVDGIPLIEVDGASLASYTLTGRAVGGAYEYFLYQGGMNDPTDGNWYLRSQWLDVCEDDPAAPGCAVDPGPGPDPGEGGEGGEGIDPVDPIRPPPVLRPEAGAYLANQSAAVNMFAHRLGDRIGAPNSGDGRNAWARMGRQQADFSAVGGQLSVDGSTSVLQIGSDLLRRGDVVFGVMLGSGRADSSVVSQLTGYGAKGGVRGNAVGVYGTWLQNGGGDEGAYVDANVQVGRFDNRVHGVGLERENYDARMTSASLESGYTFNAWQGASSALYLQPQLQLSYVDFRADRHVEGNGTVVDGSEAGGLSSRVGVRAFGRSTAAGNVVQPYLGVNWLRSSGTSTLQFNGDTLGADVPRNRYEVQAGAELKLGQRWGAWAGMTVQRGDHGYRNVGGQVGMRMVW